MLQLDILAQGYAREISETHSQGKSYRDTGMVSKATRYNILSRKHRRKIRTSDVKKKKYDFRNTSSLRMTTDKN